MNVSTFHSLLWRRQILQVLLLVITLTAAAGTLRYLLRDTATTQAALDHEARAIAVWVKKLPELSGGALQQHIDRYPLESATQAIYIFQQQLLLAHVNQLANFNGQLSSAQLQSQGFVISEQSVEESNLRILVAGKEQAWSWWPELLLALLGSTLGMLLAFFNVRRLNNALGDAVHQLRRQLGEAITRDNFESHLKLDNSLAPLREPLQLLFARIVNVQQQVVQSDAKNSELRHEVEQRIRIRTQELEESRSEAERANEAKSNFLATMSHELRTPMNGIIGTIDLLRKTRLSQPQYRMTDTIRDSSFSLLRILDDILDFSKIEAGKLELELIPLSLNEVVESVGHILGSMASQKHLDLRLFVDPAIPEGLLGDPVRLRQILYNLAGNALKFTETTAGQTGRVCIRAELVDSNMEFSRVRLVVRDNGKGMSQRQQQTIFQPFTQAEGSITRKYGGTGLGLSICQRLTELMYGRIHLDSEVGKGTEFVVELPMRRSDESHAMADVNLSDVQILVLSSDVDHQETIETYCQSVGASVVQLASLESLTQWVSSAPARTSVRPLFVVDTCNAPHLLQALTPLWTSPGLQHNPVLVLTDKPDLADESTDLRMYLQCQPLVRSALFESLQILTGKKAKAVRDSTLYDPKLSAPSVEQARAQGRVILLAEDNPMNQKVITDQLQALGYAVEIADDGQMALDKWRQYRYPLLLTDLAMPNLSGYDLAQAIRREADQYDDDDSVYTRIVAITANALKGEDKKCFAVGMDDFITKPIELESLKRVLEHWLPAAQSFISADALTAQHQESPICFTTIANFLGKDPKKHAEFLNYLVRHGADLLKELQNASETQDRKRLHGLAHQLKSVAKSVGAIELSAQALLLEQQAEQAQWTEIHDLFAELALRYQDVAKFVTQHY